MILDAKRAYNLQSRQKSSWNPNLNLVTRIENCTSKLGSGFAEAQDLVGMCAISKSAKKEKAWLSSPRG